MKLFSKIGGTPNLAIIVSHSVDMKCFTQYLHFHTKCSHFTRDIKECKYDVKECGRCPQEKKKKKEKKRKKGPRYYYYFIFKTIIQK